MKKTIRQCATLFLVIFCACGALRADNQTVNVSPVLVGEPLPFSIEIELADFTLPQGIQSAAAAQNGSEYLFIAGRSNGLHGFDTSSDNFPSDQQNTTVFVINPAKGTVYTRSLYDALSGLTQQQIDSLSVTSPQYYQRGNTLYITGGYGVDTSTGNFSTKDTLSAINIPGLIYWVKNPKSFTRASDYIRQISNPLFQVTGGVMSQFGKNPTLLVFGQNFDGNYDPTSNGNYTQQVRRFYIIDNGNFLGVRTVNSTTPDSNYRRRDLNVVPIVKITPDNKKIAAFVALSGVFTPSIGVWTVPVEITANGNTSMVDPNLQTAFMQGMNNYACAHTQLLSRSGNMYILLFGGITYEYYQDGEFLPDPELPFTNQVTAVLRNNGGNYTQYLLPTEYPTIATICQTAPSTLLFGTGAKFMPAQGIPAFTNGVLDLSKIKRPTTIGYIIGGIQSKCPNTLETSDSAASQYVFKVTLTPH